jgi:hypothetical protein
MPFIAGEETNFGGPIPGRSDYDNSAASAFCAGAVARVTASYQTFHYDGGIYGRLPDDNVARLAQAFVLGLDTIPMVDAYDVWFGHHARSAFRRAPFAPADDTRTVENHVAAGNLWRIVGTGNYAVGIMEAERFRAQDHADRGIQVLARVADHGRACGVYIQ